MRIIILGTSGQLGSSIFRYLTQVYPKAHIIGCVRSLPVDSLDTFSTGNHTYLAFDPFLDDWIKLGQADVLINCIGIIKEMPEFSFDKVHQGLTDLLIQHQQVLGNPQIIQLSALGASVNSKSGFLKTKALADEALLKHPQTVVLRPSIVCTPGTMLRQKLRFLKKLSRLMGGYLLFPKPLLKIRIQPVAIQDLVEVVANLCRSDSGFTIIEKGGREVYTLAELLQIYRIKIIPVPGLLFRFVAPVMTRFFPAFLDKEQLLMLQKDNVANNANFISILNREISSTLSFWQQESKA